MVRFEGQLISEARKLVVFAVGSGCLHTQKEEEGGGAGPPTFAVLRTYIYTTSN